MNDEATAHYYAMVEQMVEGHQWLQQHLGLWAYLENIVSIFCIFFYVVGVKIQ